MAAAITSVADRVLLHQAVQRGLLGAVAFVLDRGAIGSPLGLVRRGSHDGLAVGEPVRSQAVVRASIALILHTAWPIRKLSTLAMVAAMVPLMAAAAPRVQAGCPALPVQVQTTRAETIDMVCAGARDALEFLHWLPRDPMALLHIDLVDALPSGLRPDAVGCYAIKSRRLMVLEQALFLQRGTWFGVPVSARLWQAVVAHEVAHALVGFHLQGRGLPSAAHEHVAYVTMFATLDAATRAAALAAKPGSGFEHDAEINDARYAVDPMLFGVESYRHWLRKPDGIEYLRSVLRGSVVPEWPP